ncbi:MAG: hypothetical protein QM648_12025 [Solirubrobacterales bacterium]
MPQSPSNKRLRAQLAASFPLAAVLLALAACTATAGTYGSTPVNISPGRGGTPANGASGEPAVSGDNRSVRYVAYSSLASNLVSGDTNGVSDIFVWRRPRGGFPHSVGQGKLLRISVGPGRRQANGASANPSVDGSMVNRPHCVAFQSTATNLSPKDALPDSDIYVRDLRRGRTVLVSNGITADATDVSIAGNCKKAVFEAGGKVYWSRVGAGKPRSLGNGTQPAYARDGKSIVFRRSGGRIVFRHGGFKAVLSNGTRPRVSDYSTGHGWAVVYNSGGNVKLGLINRGHKSVQTAVRRAIVGGVTSRAAHRGIVVWARRSALFYLNRHTGNSDDLAYARQPITEIASSARANLIAFAAQGGYSFIDTKNNAQPSVYAKWLPK